MAGKQEYLQRVEEKLEEWEEKILHVKQKAERLEKDSEWLQHAIEKQEEVNELLDKLRSAGEDDFEKQKARIAIATEELETALVRAAERFEESAELGTDPARRAETKEDGHGSKSIHGRRQPGMLGPRRNRRRTGRQ